DEIADVFREALLLAPIQAIREGDRLGRNAHADRRALAGRALADETVAARALVDALADASDGIGGKLTPNAGARIGQAPHAPSGERVLVCGGAQRLLPHRSIPLEAEALERAKDLVAGARTRPRQRDIPDPDV